ncbi:3-oxo-5-alpha-steroid 4-dehydrogenase-domain-containing protein [Syncephalastrum racemosum]|uniref:3-oxo-5-alpha-steroid 4-dehydrogenase-domain-containing protein n=1 Tax=Syncephalastrum racemosum TaxID=13706 RepID=A0A1X2HP41_SYNRA|nr:3-oxo-5-alpha-steroid 4-dehydrogenase-domain-containing protein [Syncephalastrum racemosum]
MILVTLLRVCLISLALLAFVTKRLAFLRATVLAYGRLNHTADRPQSNLQTRLQRLTVPKAWFSHFYFVGLAFAAYCVIEMVFLPHGPLMYALRRWDTPEGSDRVDKTTVVISVCMIICHLARRAYESMYVEQASAQARMHVSHYLVGLGFYGAMVLAAWIEGAVSLGVWPSTPRAPPTQMAWRVAGVLLFIYASVHQYRCHAILANLKKKQKGYVIPRGDWFEYVVSPHYLADILVYVALCLVNGGRNLTYLCGLVWTVVNLSVTAGESEAWYRKTFGREYSAAFPAKRWVILPGFY